MTTQKIINKMIADGLSVVRISEILGISTVSAYKYLSGADSSHRVRCKVRKNYELYKVRCIVDRASFSEINMDQLT